MSTDKLQRRYSDDTHLNEHSITDPSAIVEALVKFKTNSTQTQF
jgi:hypothetical protein